MPTPDDDTNKVYEPKPANFTPFMDKRHEYDNQKWADISLPGNITGLASSKWSAIRKPCMYDSVANIDSAVSMLRAQQVKRHNGRFIWTRGCVNVRMCVCECVYSAHARTHKWDAGAISLKKTSSLSTRSYGTASSIGLVPSDQSWLCSAACPRGNRPPPPVGLDCPSPATAATECSSLSLSLTHSLARSLCIEKDY